MVSTRGAPSGIDSTCYSYHEVYVLGVTLDLPLAEELIFESENEVGDFLMDRNRKLSTHPPHRPKSSPKHKYAGSKCQVGNASEGPVRGEPGEAGG